jgi:hypothetical protein
VRFRRFVRPGALDERPLKGGPLAVSLSLVAKSAIAGEEKVTGVLEGLCLDLFQPKC